MNEPLVKGGQGRHGSDLVITAFASTGTVLVVLAGLAIALLANVFGPVVLIIAGAAMGIAIVLGVVRAYDRRLTILHERRRRLLFQDFFQTAEQAQPSAGKHTPVRQNLDVEA